MAKSPKPRNKSILRFRSIQQKILLLFLCLGIILIVIYSIMSEYFMQQMLTTMVNENISQQTKSFSRILGNWFGERMHEMESYARIESIYRMDWESSEGFLKSQAGLDKGSFLFFILADTNGNYRTTYTNFVGNISDRPYFSVVMNGKPIVSDPVISKSLGIPIVVVAYPIVQGDKVVGLLGGCIPIETIRTLIEPFRLSVTNSYGFLIAANGMFVAHPIRTLMYNSNFYQLIGSENRQISNIMRLMSVKESGSVQYNRDRILNLGFFASVPMTLGWKIVMRVPMDYITTPMNDSRMQLMLIAMTGLILAGWISYQFAKTISEPIIRLRDFFNRAAAGSLVVRAEVDSDDEIGEALTSFNAMMETISNMTNRNPVTDLPNKKMFEDRLALEIRFSSKTEKRFAVIFLNLDRFKKLNETLGHQEGDKILRLIANRLRQWEEFGYFVCHIGVDGFCILVPDVGGGNKAVRFAQQILNEIREPLIVSASKDKFFISASIGIAFYPNDGKDPRSLLQNADAALYLAKKNGGAGYQLYTSTLNDDLKEQVFLENNMQLALRNNEFQVYYQPLIDAKTGKISGIEALARWFSPTMGTIPPMRFIPIAEETGFIIQLGEWVLRKACSANRKWQDKGYRPITMSVNISSRQFQIGHFIEMIQRVLKDTGMSPEYLELEITESIAMQDIENKIVLMNHLSELGVQIAIDDFGTGYSSLNYLGRFTINKLKIDQSFVRDIPQMNSQSAVAQSIIALGHNLHLKVTAEGVEHSPQFDFLRDANCDTIQGFIFSKPVSEDEFEKLLSEDKSFFELK